MTPRTTQRLARLLAAGSVIAVARALAAHHPDPATAAESAYLAVLAGAVLGALALGSRATGAVVAAGIWTSVCLVLPAAGGTRGALVVAGLAAATAWATWAAMRPTASGGAAAMVAVTFAWQALLRGDALLPPLTIDALPALLGPALLLAAAAAHLARSDGERFAVAALAPLLLLATGPSLVPAASLLALAVLGDRGPATRTGRWAVVAAALLALLRWPEAGVPLLVLIAALALRRHAGWRWLPGVLALAWTIACWSGPPVSSAWLLLLVPWAALAGRDRWPTGLAACALLAGQAAGADDPALLAPAVALLLASVPADGPAVPRQAAWGLALLAVAGTAAAYPWLRQPLALVPDLGAGALLAPLVAVLLWRLGHRFAPAWRPRPAWLGLAALAVPAVFLAQPARPLLVESVVLGARGDAWSVSTGGAAVGRVVVDSFLMNAGGVADGTAVAVVRIVTPDGARHETVLRQGEHTADWAAARLAGAYPAPWLRWVASDRSLAQRYRATWRPARALAAASLEVERAPELPDAVDIALLQVTVQ